MVGWFGMVLLAAVGAADSAPSRGDVWRTIYTDQGAFEVADRNRDGKISEYEFDIFYASRGGYDRKLSNQVNTPPKDYDANGAFTPDELYAEARDFDRDGYYRSRRERRDDYYGNPYDD